MSLRRLLKPSFTSKTKVNPNFINDRGLLRSFVIELPRSPLINLDFKTGLNLDKVMKLQNL